MEKEGCEQGKGDEVGIDATKEGRVKVEMEKGRRSRK